MSDTIQLYDAHGRRLYLSAAERDAFLDAATHADRPLRTLCSVLYYTGCRISEALALIARRIDLHDQTIIFESLKKRRRGVYRAVPVPPSLLDTLDMVHGLPVRHTNGTTRRCWRQRCGRGPVPQRGGRSKRSCARQPSRTVRTRVRKGYGTASPSMRCPKGCR